MKKTLKVLKILYLLAELAIFAAFVYFDAKDQILLSNHVKYTGIAVNTLALLVILGCKKKTAGAIYEKRNTWIVLALLLTLGADTFLILLDTNYFLGVCLFCLVETCYALYLLSRSIHKGRDICFRLAILAAAILIPARMDILDALTAAAIYSMVMLTWNVIFSMGNWGRERGRANCQLAWGLLLFWLCDACVGLRNITDYIPKIPAIIPQAAGTLIWIFYLPAQVLILLSLANRIYKKKKK